MARAPARSVEGGRRTPRPPSTSLARPGDPLVLGNGKLVNDPKSRKDENYDIKDHLKPETFRPQKRRGVKELPSTINMMNGIAAVFMYTLYGLTDREIADALHITPDDVLEVRKHPAYTESFEVIYQEFLSANSDLLTSRIAAASHSAFGQVVALSQGAENELVQLKASTDILDRSGARPQDTASRKAVGQNDLRIVIIDNERSVEVDVAFNHGEK